jgi:hypothetical protein
VNHAFSPEMTSAFNQSAVPFGNPMQSMTTDSAPVATIPAMPTGKADTSFDDGIPGEVERAKSSYRRTQRFLSLCEAKISVLENDPEAFEKTPIRDLRNLVRCVYDLEKQAQAYADVIRGQGNPPVGRSALPTNGKVGTTQEALPANPQRHPVFGKKHGKKFR